MRPAMRHGTFLCAALVLAPLSGPACGVRAAPPEVNLESLLEEMVQRERLARLPDPWYTCRQASSYDRDTVARDKPGWFANWDRSQFIRTETNGGRTEHVLMDAEGPGAIVHFWATWHGPGGGPFTNGTLRVYLDGSSTPAIEGPTEDIISKGMLVGPPLGESVSPRTEYEHRGHNLYLPIPYARHCKVTYETKVLIDRGARKGEALYYQINYRTYAEGTRVRSFSMADLTRLRSRIARTQNALMGGGLEPRQPLERAVFDGSISPGAAVETSLKGPAAIRELTVRIDAKNLEQALRSTVLEIFFDGKLSVWCPVGDFFGTGYRRRPYRTWYTRVTLDGGMTCWWVMPFEKTCRIVLRNLGAQKVEASLGSARVGRWKWDAGSMRFHAFWRQYTRIATGPNKNMSGEGAFDVNYVAVEGQGVYAGDTLTLFNGTDAWWGEGDEKIFVDGEDFPSHIGTGSEDYYGYAWCKPAYFCMPFHAQPDGSGNLAVGFSVNSRYRSLDAIPFRKSIRFDMELWHWRKTRMNYAPTSFWYARPGAACNVKPDPKTAALKVALREDDVIDIFRIPGAIEGESLRIVRRTGGKTEVQSSPEYGWSGNRQLWWLDGKPGDELVLEFPVKETGKYRVKAHLTKAVDYAAVDLAIDGRKAAAALDAYRPEVESAMVDLGVFELKKGARKLEVRIAGANPKAVKRHMFGLDCILLEPLGE